jgi:flagellar basal body-associated protein FliL
MTKQQRLAVLIVSVVVVLAVAGFLLFHFVIDNKPTPIQI